MQLGANLTSSGTSFRVWAPAVREVELVIESPHGGAPARHALAKGDDGHHRLEVARALAPAGTLYRFCLDGEGPYPDPCSRFQPAGPHGASMIVDPLAHAWKDDAWSGIALEGQVIYELHVGTFTQAGTFDAAIDELNELRELGITVIELMPVAEFPGRWNWGYDGVQLFAPYHGYGDEHAMRRFVAAAHARGIAVILDVVFNHLGPDGNYLGCYSRGYFTDRYENDWGEALNFDGEGAGPVRELFLEATRRWMREFHLDGLRLDATQSIHDVSQPHILQEIVQAAREAAAPRRIIVTAENEPQRSEHLLAPEEGGFGLDAMWNDDFHHSARVALTGRSDGYFSDHRGRAQELVSAVRRGFLFQGQHYRWQSQPRGSPHRGPAASLIVYLQNHDQVANTFFGQRLSALASAARLRAMTTLLLLAPQTPLLFMGQEFASSAPFPFFADHGGELGPQVHQGRREFLRQFPRYAGPGAQRAILDPADEATFRAAKLDFAERERHADIYRLHQDLLALRARDPAIRLQDWRALDGAVLGEHCLVLRWFASEGDRLLLLNYGADLELVPAPEPLLAPPRGARWSTCFCSENPRYGGSGCVEVCSERGWHAPGDCAVLLVAETVAGVGRGLQ